MKKLTQAQKERAKKIHRSTTEAQKTVIRASKVPSLIRELKESKKKLEFQVNLTLDARTVSTMLKHDVFEVGKALAKKMDLIASLERQRLKDLENLSLAVVCLDVLKEGVHSESGMAHQFDFIKGILRRIE